MAGKAPREVPVPKDGTSNSSPQRDAPEGPAMPEVLQLPTCVMRQVALADLKMDPTYQRPTDFKRAQGYADNWDDTLAGVLYVGERSSGDKFTIDGGHRQIGAGKAGKTSLLCMVMPSPGPAWEAAMFRQLNRERRPITKADDHRAGLTAKDPTALGVEALLVKHGLTGRAGRRIFKAVGTLASLYRIDAALTTAVFDALVPTWKQEGDKTIPYNALTGLFHLCDTHTPATILTEHNRKTLQRKGIDKIIKEILSCATTRNGDARTAALGILTVINMGFKGANRIDSAPLASATPRV